VTFTCKKYNKRRRDIDRITVAKVSNTIFKRRYIRRLIIILALLLKVASSDKVHEKVENDNKKLFKSLEELDIIEVQ
jgi:hypothetical protein